MILQIKGKDKKGDFTVGLILKDHIVVKTAPKVNYMMFWPSSRVQQYCFRRGWRVSRVIEKSEPEPTPV